ncbi:hypothetical protein JYU21_02410 [Alkaliphilus sp. AH-315-G20]|nr:hypothetical protein [Alkaliphilus sp. AH-315-G20]
MTDEQRKMHKKLAVDCFNSTWDLIDIKERTKKEDYIMIKTALDSLYHWMQIGEPLNFARGEWQVSRVYSLAGDGKSALAHGENSLKYCLENGIGGFDLSFAYESIARAYSLLGDEENEAEYIELAKESAELIGDNDNKNYLISELNTI